MEIIPGKWCRCLILLQLLLFGVICQTKAAQVSVCCKESELQPYQHIYTKNCTFENLKAPQLSELVFTNCQYYQEQHPQVYFKNSFMYEFPRNWFKFRPYTQTLSIDNCGLTSMSRYSFEYAVSKLTKLTLTRNNLTVLEAAVFSHLAELQAINLFANNIIEVDENAFNGLTKLTVLSLSSNKIEKLESGVFQPLLSLIWLDLSNNWIEVIETDIFELNSELATIKLQQNKIMVVQDFVFVNLLKLKELHLYSNKLIEFNMTEVSAQKVFLNNNQIQRLHIPDTLIELSAARNNISEISCADNTKLQKLNLSNNNLTKLGCVANLADLEELSMSFNQLGSVNISAFASLGKLKILDLDYTQISAPEFGTFSHLEEMTSLDISYNQFKEFDLSVMAGLRKLNYLYIDGNNLTEFDYKSVRLQFPVLTVIGIADNNFNCSYLSQIAKEFSSKAIVYSPANLAKVRDRSNVNGIACTDEKNKKNIWKTPVQHTTMGNHSEDMQVMNTQINDLIDNVNALNKSAGTLDTIKSDYHDLTLLFHKLQERVQNQEADLLKTKLSILTNNTNTSSINLSNDLKNVIEQMNNLTIDRQNLNNDVMKQKLYEMSFQVEKISNKVDELSSKMQAIQKLESNAVKSSHPMTDALRDHSINQSPAAGGAGTVNIIILVLLIIIVFAISIAGVAYYIRMRYVIPLHNMSRTTTRTFDTQLLDHQL